MGCTGVPARFTKVLAVPSGGKDREADNVYSMVV